MESHPILMAGLVGAFGYAIYASRRAYKESGERWMLWQPHWIDRESGVSDPTRRHGRWAFALLLLMTGAFLVLR